MTNDQASTYNERLAKAATGLSTHGLDLLFATPSADLTYLLGYVGHPSERPTILAIRPQGTPVLLIPRLEATGADSLSGIDLLPYEEAQDPIAVLHSALGPGGNGATVGISDQAWATIVLRLQDHFTRSRFVSASILLRDLRMHKDERELGLLREAGQKTDEAFHTFAQRPFAGRTEIDMARELSTIMTQRGLKTGDWGPIIASGPNSASPHHVPGDRVVREGDAVLLDFGGRWHGYRSDMTRTVHVGQPGALFSQVYEVVRRAQESGVHAVRAGASAGSVDLATRQVIEEAGFGDAFFHRTGHGLGLDIHEEPYIIAGNTLPLADGMVFSVEPGVYLTGRFGVRIEDIVAVSEGTGTRLNEAQRELVIVH